MKKEYRKVKVWYSYFDYPHFMDHSPGKDWKYVSLFKEKMAPQFSGAKDGYVVFKYEKEKI